MLLMHQHPAIKLKTNKKKTQKNTQQNPIEKIWKKLNKNHQVLYHSEFKKNGRFFILKTSS